MSYVLGKNARLYYDTTGVATPTWTECVNVKDLTLNMEAGVADVTTRANGGYKAEVGTIKEVSVDFGMVYDNTDANWTAIHAAFIAQTTIGFAVVDGNIVTAGTEGFYADFVITKFDIDESLEEAMTVAVTAKVTYSATDPAWTTT